MRAFHQIPGARESGRGNAGLEQRFGGGRRRPGAGPGGQGCVDGALSADALIEIESGHGRQARHDIAQGAPFRVGARNDADPVVVALAAPYAVGCMMRRCIAHRFRRCAELARDQGLGHGPQHRLDHREIDARHAAFMLPMPERGGGDKGKHQATHGIEPRQPDARRDLGMTIEPGKSGVALQQRPIRDGLRIRPRSPHPRCGDIDEVRVHGLQRLGAETQPVHDAGGEVFDQDVGLRGKGARDLDSLRLLQVKDDALLRLAKHRMQFRCAPRVAGAGCFDLDDLRAHGGKVARRRRTRDHPAEIEHTYAGQRHRAIRRSPFAARRDDTEAERRARHLNCLSGKSVRTPVPAMAHLRRVEMLGDVAQGKARHVRALRGIGDPLLVVLPAPLRHQRMQGIPVLHPIGLGDEARVVAPGG